MAKTESTMLALGTVAPDFSLTDPRTGDSTTLSDVRGEGGTLVAFICNHCPFVIHIFDHLPRLAEECAAAGVGMVAINANSVLSHPQDGPENMKKLAEAKDWSFPFLFDETQETAKSYTAACTPDFFLFDADNRLFYRGQLDDSRPDSGIPVTGESLSAAIAALKAGAEAPAEQWPSMGCNIKWIPGNAPSYFG